MVTTFEELKKGIRVRGVTVLNFEAPKGTYLVSIKYNLVYGYVVYFNKKTIFKKTKQGVFDYLCKEIPKVGGFKKRNKLNKVITENEKLDLTIKGYRAEESLERALLKASKVDSNYMNSGINITKIIKNIDKHIKNETHFEFQDSKGNRETFKIKEDYSIYVLKKVRRSGIYPGHVVSYGMNDEEEVVYEEDTSKYRGLKHNLRKHIESCGVYDKNKKEEY